MKIEMAVYSENCDTIFSAGHVVPKPEHSELEAKLEGWT